MFSLIGPLGGPEILIILVLVLVLFGAKKLPEAGRSIGQGMREFKHGVTGKGGDDEPEQIERPAKVDATTTEADRSPAERPRAGTAGDSTS
jgi:sec-independent protein translocase protein TatA